LGTPAWLYYLFAVLMLAVAAYGMVLLVVSVAMRQASGRDVDVAHVVMGVSMAGMFVGHWAFGPSAVWELIFAALLVWFAARSVLSIRRFGLHLPHQAIHAAMSFAMLLMYVYPTGSSTGSMSMAGSSSGRLDPGLGLLLAMIFFASAIFTLASPNKGASHHGRHILLSVPPRPDPAARGPAGAALRSRTVEALVATPWLEDASHVVMAIGMGFMLILML